MEATMNIKLSHTLDELLKLYETESNSKLARRIHAVSLVSKGLTCTQIITITGAGHYTIQKWVKKYNHGGIEELEGKPHPGHANHSQHKNKRNQIK